MKKAVYPPKRVKLAEALIEDVVDYVTGKGRVVSELFDRVGSQGGVISGLRNDISELVNNQGLINKGLRDDIEKYKEFVKVIGRQNEIMAALVEELKVDDLRARSNVN